MAIFPMNRLMRVSAAPPTFIQQNVGQMSIAGRSFVLGSTSPKFSCSCRRRDLLSLSLILSLDLMATLLLGTTGLAIVSSVAGVVVATGIGIAFLVVASCVTILSIIVLIVAMGVFAFALLLTGICTAITIWICLVIFYRLCLHPLRIFPGPRLASITACYRAYYDLIKGGEFLNHLKTLHVKFGQDSYDTPFEQRFMSSCLGPVVRIGPNHVSLLIHVHRATHRLWSLTLVTLRPM